jgi:tetrahydromethanopterin S-methyltransferase subunit E
VLRKLVAIALNVVAIILCGALGAAVGYGVVTALGLAGVPAAIVAALIAMVVATAAWAGGSTLWRALSRRR